ncbi:MAG: phosphoribosylglycinamide formyltransferase [bacterium]|nr:phosphoribosylglycinamide formyltransferase [bacterium]
MLIIGVLASGKGSNLQAIIDNIASGKLNAKIGCVISDNADAFALERAKKAQIPAYHIPYKNILMPQCEVEYIECLNKHNVELVCLAGFMRIIKPTLLNAFKNRIINIHPALLPAFPGLHAQKQAYDYGVKVTGATVHFVDEGMDTGRIILQRTVEIKSDDTEETLSERILRVEHQIYSEAIQLFADKQIQKPSKAG